MVRTSIFLQLIISLIIGISAVFGYLVCIDDNCFEKCCPRGMSLARTRHFCQNVPGNLSIFPSTPALNRIIRNDDDDDDEAESNCSNKMFQSEFHHFDKCFTILPNGSMMRFNPIGKKSTSSTNMYCIDRESNDDGSLSVVGFNCLKPVTNRQQPDRNWVTENVYPYLLFISSIFLLITFVVYSIVPEIRNIHGICVMCHVISMAVAYIGLGIVEMSPDVSKGLCITLASVTHYASLSAFAWLSVMSFDIWRGFSHLRPTARCTDGKMHQKRRLLLYSIYAWTVPFIITLTGFIADRTDEKNAKRCWFENEKERQNDRRIIRPHFGEGGRCWFPYTGDQLAPNVAYLYAPVGFLLFMNVFFFMMTTIAFYRINLDTALATSGKVRARQKFRAIFSIFILMGVSWISKLISDVVVRDESVTWMVTDIFNILTNGLVFFIMVICKPTVWNRLRSKYPSLKRLEVLDCCQICTVKNKKRQSNQEPVQHTSDSSESLPNNTSIHEDVQCTVPEAHNMMTVAVTVTDNGHDHEII